MAMVAAALLEQCRECDCDISLPVQGGELAGHKHVLHARCPKLGQTAMEESAVVETLLHWVYAGTIDWKLTEAADANRIVQLAELWGMRDVHALRQSLWRSWRDRHGSVARDLLRAYDERRLGQTWFRCESGARVYAGFVPLLAKASTFFAAMFSSRWMERSDSEMQVSWDASTMARLIRFLHGGPSYVQDAQDLEQALVLSEFFGMAVLVAHGNAWIAEHLDATNAPQLWSLLESQPRLQLTSLQDPIFNEDAFVDADDACFDFHIQKFLAIAGDESEDGWVPLHDLTSSLMYRLLASGRLDVNTNFLKSVVSKFVERKMPQGEAKAALQELLPPAVLFNRELRSQVLHGVHGNVRDLL